MVTQQRQSANRAAISIAPITLPLQCGKHTPTVLLTPEVLSAQARRCRCECEKLEAGSVCWSDGVHSLITKQILHSTNKREMFHKATLQDQTTVMW